ncbi:MAG: Fic family protein, partial [Actinomycetota bacterium]
AMFDNLNRFIVPAVAGPSQLVPLAALVDAHHTLAGLRQAAQRGRLEAIQGADGLWMSSRAAVEAYDGAKHQRRPVRD